MELIQQYLLSQYALTDEQHVKLEELIVNNINDIINIKASHEDNYPYALLLDVNIDEDKLRSMVDKVNNPHLINFKLTIK